MRGVVAALPCRAAIVGGGWCRLKGGTVELSPRWRCKVKQMRMMRIEAEMVNSSTYTSRVSLDVPLYEIPGASFDEYLEDKGRVFEAICPDKLRSHQTSEEEWRVEMVPIHFLFLSVSPVVDMRLTLKSSGIGYPPQVPPHISKLLDLQITRWELEGLGNMLEPLKFFLTVKGLLYPDRRRGPRSSIRGQMQMSVGFVLPDVLAFLPQQTRQDAAETVSKKLLERMRSKATARLIADYDEFKKERALLNQHSNTYK